MSKKREELVEAVANVLAVCVSIAAIIGVIFIAILFVQWSFRGVGNWWHTTTSKTPEEQKAYDKAVEEATEEWKTNPQNPEYVGKLCLERGGIPTYSNWDGEVTSCKGTGDKNVNIEVNQ